MHDEPLTNTDASVGEVRSFSDDELLLRLSDLLDKSRGVEAELIVHIGEVDDRRLYAREGSPSMFAYCVDVLRLSEHEAYLRITVARAAREHRLLLTMLAEGRLHLSGIAKLVPHLTHANRKALLERAAHKSKRQIEEMVARLAPRADVPTLTRRLPEPRRPEPSPVGPAGAAPTDVLELGLDRVPTAAAAPSPALVQPLAPGRYKVQFTASAAFHDKLQRLKDLMRSAVPDGDLAAILEEAVSEKLQRLEARRFGRTKSTREAVPTMPLPSSRYVPAAVKRVVHERDGGRCRYLNRRGRRCRAREGLEFHHVKGYARGGDASPENIQLMCRAHNAYLAERDYGKAHMILSGSRRSIPGSAGGPAAERPSPSPSRAGPVRAARPRAPAPA